MIKGKKDKIIDRKTGENKLSNFRVNGIFRFVKFIFWDIFSSVNHS